MQATAEHDAMPKKPKKSESRKHEGVLRVDKETLERAKIAASLMKKSLADYASEGLRKLADKDIDREAKKLIKGGEH
jgi:predicted HicB family RNase H-like nuclease